MAQLAPVALAMMVAGKVAGAVGDYNQQRAAANVDDENARRAELTGAFDQTSILHHERATSGEALAAQAGGGLAVGTGSAFDLLYSNAMERDRAILTSRFTSESEAATLRDQAKAKRKAATAGLIGGLLGAGASAIAGAGDLASAGRIAGAAAAARAPLAGGYRMQTSGGL